MNRKEKECPMRRRRRSSFRKEKAIMLVSSCLVLTALTATGLYVRNKSQDKEDGYELTYGQLTDLTVAEGDIVTTGEIIGQVAEPTKYYSVEGCNVYFKLTKDGQPVNPLNRLS